MVVSKIPWVPPEKRVHWNPFWSTCDGCSSEAGTSLRKTPVSTEVQRGPDRVAQRGLGFLEPTSLLRTYGLLTN